MSEVKCIGFGEACESLKYDPDSGVFTWLTHRGNIKAGQRAGHLSRDGYVYITVNGSRYLAHRLAILMATGTFPDVEVDHINGVRSDNRIINLRETTHKINLRNQKRYKNNLSGVSGVFWKAQKGKWEAQIGSYSNRVFIGNYFSFFDAVAARKSAELKNDYHENHGVRP